MYVQCAVDCRCMYNVQCTMYNVQRTPVPAQDLSRARSWEPGCTLVRFVCNPDVLNVIAAWDRCYLVPVPGTILPVVHCAVHVRCRVGTGSSLDVQVQVQVQVHVQSKTKDQRPKAKGYAVVPVAVNTMHTTYSAAVQRSHCASDQR
jgi:hypothetical protein